ncbi:MAG: polysaccharide deacetylase family protein [Deltaproteobacteria bacterium]|nr:polysaccharide deacetylase family protein [Deltaproteobacteria bacterium]
MQNIVNKIPCQIVTLFHDVEQDFDSQADPQACRDAVAAFLKMEKRYGINVTYNVVGKLFLEQPDLIEMIVDHSHEIAYHSYSHPADWHPGIYAEQVALCAAISKSPRGYRSPRSKWDETTLKALWKHGFDWTAEGDPVHNKPYYIYQNLIRLPITTDDYSLYTNYVTLDNWVKTFEKCLDTRFYVAIGMHDCYASLDLDKWLEGWENILRLCRAKNAVLLTFSEAASRFRKI